MRVVLQATLAAVMVWPSADFAAMREPVAEARVWLRLIDQGRFAESWSQAGALFRGAATQAEWVRKVTIARGPLGPLVTRADGTVNRIRRLRFDRGEMTQAELAGRVGLTRQTVAAIEQGKYSPTLEAAFRIADALGEPLDAVFQWQGRASGDS